MTDPTTPTPPDQQPLLPAVPADHSESRPQAPTEVAAEHKHGRRRLLLASAAGAAFLLLVGVGAFAAMRATATEGGPPETKSPFATAKEKCGSAATGEAELGDEGKTLTLHGDGKESSGLSYSTLECYWSALDMPDSVKAEVEATRALDGRQSGDWADIHASWSYHPDSGLQMVLTRSN
ncbi:hypothetical protein EAD89_15130 [Micromonospora sp. BL4]|uniref:hypothetical protein n=1 Tax=Micromonospora sp. BL4 TaxID=2478710 RepID=UPI000EF5AAEB|nr:hypothetical protein [Micromonospora sp. BL4]RLP89283.1 hypothetical protein EAD89_15130 [Micromonospora sp. BL4]